MKLKWKFSNNISSGIFSYPARFNQVFMIDLIPIKSYFFLIRKDG